MRFRPLRALTSLALCFFPIPPAFADETRAPETLNLPLPASQSAPAQMTKVARTGGTVTLARSFLDEFDSFTPNAPPWRHHFGHGPYDKVWSRTLSSNLEEQVYVDPDFAGTGSRALRLNPFSTRDGILSITARKTPDAALQQLDNMAYTSGLLSTEYTFEQRYGFFEARLRVPEGQGLWPAFWLKRSPRHVENGTSPWPPEIDIMEHLGSRPDRYHVTVHWDVHPANKKSGLPLPISAPTERFYNYGVLWMEDRTVFYLDREPVAQIETKPNHHVPMFMILNLAVGGRWPGPADPTVLPAQFDIDWVAAWQVVPDSSN